MGRYYNAPQGVQFVDGLYTPPWEMINKSLEQNQQGYENALTTTNLFDNLDIKYIEDPVIKEQVEKIKGYYSNKANSITEAIKANPMDWRKSGINIQNLSKELQEDMKSGDISRFQDSYQSLSNFLEQHKEIKTKNPGDFNRGYEHFLNEWRKDPLRMEGFNWEQLVNPIDTESINKRIKDLAANATEQANGMWLVGNEEVTPERIMESAKNQIFGDSANSAYIQQQIKFKNPDYYNEEYASVNGGSGFYDKMYLDPNTGKVIPDTEAEKRIADYEREKIDYYTQLQKGKKPKVPQLNVVQKKGAIGNLMDSLVAQNAYSKQTLKPNSNYIATLNYELDKIKNKDDKELAEAKLEVEKGKNKFEKTKYYNELKQKKMAKVVDLINDVTKNISLLDPSQPDDKVKIEELEKKKKELMSTYEKYISERVGEDNDDNVVGTDGTAGLLD